MLTASLAQQAGQTTPTFLHRFRSSPGRRSTMSSPITYAASRAYHELLSEEHELQFANPSMVAAALIQSGFKPTKYWRLEVHFSIRSGYGRLDFFGRPPEGNSLADAIVNPYQPGKDTRPLSPNDLSPTEVAIIREIERRISMSEASGKPDRRDSGDDYLAYAQRRFRRVLLLDGDRGTGKTSVLVTLVQDGILPRLPSSTKLSARSGPISFECSRFWILTRCRPACLSPQGLSKHGDPS